MVKLGVYSCLHTIHQNPLLALVSIQIRSPSGTIGSKMLTVCTWCCPTNGILSLRRCNRRIESNRLSQLSPTENRFFIWSTTATTVVGGDREWETSKCQLFTQHHMPRCCMGQQLCIEARVMLPARFPVQLLRHLLSVKCRTTVQHMYVV